MDLSHKIIIGLLIILILILLIIYKKQENVSSISGNTNYNSEALANIASVYANTNEIATFNNIQITGNLKIGGYMLSVDASNNLNIKDLSNNTIFTGQTNNVNIPFMTGGVIKNSKLTGCGLMDNEGRYGLYVNKVWNNKYGILMYDINSDGKGTWISMPTRISNGQLGYGNGYIRAINFATPISADGDYRGGARFFYVGRNDTDDPEKPVSTQIFEH